MPSERSVATILSLLVSAAGATGAAHGQDPSADEPAESIAARAVDGAANAALAEFLAKCLGVARREVRILRGEKSRQKLIWAPLSPESALRRLEGTNR